jgi:hypothetical protein
VIDEAEELCATMSVDTELVLACNLKHDVPEEVLHLLRFLCEGERAVPRPSDLPAHPFFRTERWQSVLNAGSYHLPSGGPSARLIIKEWKNVTGAQPPKSLIVRCDLKNYDFEIQYFLQWFAPYSRTSGFVGYYRHEEALHPTLIYFFPDGKVALLEPTDEQLIEKSIDLDAYLAYDQEQQGGEKR